MTTDTTRVLLVEDNEHDAEIVQRMLGRSGRSFVIEWVRSTEECVERLDVSAFDLLLLDYSLPAEDGLSFLRRVAGTRELPPVIMLTGWGDARVAAEALHSGAYDYFPKNSIDSGTIVAAIDQALLKHHLRIEEIRLRRELERLAITDELTGLHNRRHLMDALDQECRRAIRYKHPLACLMLDLDEFKAYNDRFGHLLGDSLLRQVASIIGTSVRETDTAARYGGDEFFVIMPETALAEAMLVAERLRGAIESRPFPVELESPPVTVSIGVCSVDAEDDLHHTVILSRADAALRAAKAAGRNRTSSNEACSANPG